MIKHGDLSEEEALRLVTLNPAIQLRLENRIGSIDVGKDADLVLFNGHPFSVYSRPEMTLIEGEVFFDRRQDLARRETLVKEKRALIEREKKAPAQAQPTQPGARPAQTLSEDLDEHLHGHPHQNRQH
jgi:cytosine/adenosine deaminase-related metal-dependent hydrolase